MWGPRCALDPQTDLLLSEGKGRRGFLNGSASDKRAGRSWWRGRPVGCGMFSSGPGVHPLNASGTFSSSVVTTTTGSRRHPLSPGGKTTPAGNHWFGGQGTGGDAWCDYQTGRRFGTAPGSQPRVQPLPQTTGWAEVGGEGGALGEEPAWAGESQEGAMPSRWHLRVHHPDVTPDGSPRPRATRPQREKAMRTGKPAGQSHVSPHPSL